MISNCSSKKEKKKFEKVRKGADFDRVIARTSPSKVEGRCKTDKDYPISIPPSTDITVELNRWPPLQDAVQERASIK